MTSAMPVQCSTYWAIKPTGSWSYCELLWPAPSWLDSSVGRALYRHRRGHGFESHSSLNFFRLSFRNCSSCVVTARIFLLFDLSSAVQIYVSYIYIHLFILHGYITNSQYNQLPVGLIAQLVEHCTGIAEVMGSNPVQAWIFFRLSFRNCSSCVVTARIFLLFENDTGWGRIRWNSLL